MSTAHVRHRQDTRGGMKDERMDKGAKSGNALIQSSARQSKNGTLVASTREADEESLGSRQLNKDRESRLRYVRNRGSEQRIAGTGDGREGVGLR